MDALVSRDNATEGNKHKVVMRRSAEQHESLFALDKLTEDAALCMQLDSRNLLHELDGRKALIHAIEQCIPAWRQCSPGYRVFPFQA